MRDLDLHVGAGEFVVLVGPSGCGKTTALRMVAGLERISAGTLRFGDRVVNDVPPRQRDVAMVFQSYALYPHLTVAENIGFSLDNKKIPKPERQRRVRDTAAILGLTGQLNRKPRQLSGGQKQRVAMGRAIVREPAIFLMDEPLSNLDAKLRVQMRAEMLAVHRRVGATTLYVTHDQTEAMTMGDRVAVLRGGVLQQAAPPRELYDRPANLFVASFIGSPSMNLYSARLDIVGDTAELILGSQRLTLPPAVVKQSTDLASFNGAELIVGIRPEVLTDPASTGTPRGARRPASPPTWHWSRCSAPSSWCTSSWTRSGSATSQPGWPGSARGPRSGRTPAPCWRWTPSGCTSSTRPPGPRFTEPAAGATLSPGGMTYG